MRERFLLESYRAHMGLAVCLFAGLCCNQPFAVLRTM